MPTFSPESILADHDLISSPGTLAFYKVAEVTEIVLLGQDEPINIFTIVVMHEEDIAIRSSKWMSDKPITIGKEKFGISRYYVTIEKIRDQINKICNLKLWDLNGGNKLIIGSTLEPLPKQYIAPNGTYPVELNKVLKNNFKNGSYVIEIFDTGKEHLSNYVKKPKNLQILSEEIQKYLPIEIGSLSDRLGNIVFQYPIHILSVKMAFNKTDDGINIKCYWNQLLSEIPEVKIIALSEQDEKEGVFGFGIESLTQGQLSLRCGNTSTSLRYFIFDEVKKIILNSWQGNYVGVISTTINIINPEPRIFETKESGKTEIIISSSGPGVNVGDNTRNLYLKSIQGRLYEAEKKKLRDDRAFVQYFQNQRSKALNDIRALIGKFGQHGIYLWDPYLVSDDIKETIFHCPFVGQSMRAIGSYNSHKNSTVFNAVDYSDFLNTNKLSLTPSNDNNHLSVNLEFRLQHSNYGWGFHDRFIIFPGEEGKVKAWSLGTSVNSLGKSHHILQEVSNPRHVLDAFDLLWKELEDVSCLVWRS